jgi:hypothetical protein
MMMNHNGRATPPGLCLKTSSSSMSYIHEHTTAINQTPTGGATLLHPTETQRASLYGATMAVHQSSLTSLHLRKLLQQALIHVQTQHQSEAGPHAIASTHCDSSIAVHYVLSCSTMAGQRGLQRQQQTDPWQPTPVATLSSRQVLRTSCTALLLLCHPAVPSKNPPQARTHYR